jgi:hypothetical protein
MIVKTTSQISNFSFIASNPQLKPTFISFLFIGEELF